MCLGNSGGDLGMIDLNANSDGGSNGGAGVGFDSEYEGPLMR
jgi:hypothetical protein